MGGGIGHRREEDFTVGDCHRPVRIEIQGRHKDIRLLASVSSRITNLRRIVGAGRKPGNAIWRHQVVTARHGLRLCASLICGILRPNTVMEAQRCRLMIALPR
jgi:hypothetical protein